MEAGREEKEKVEHAPGKKRRVVYNNTFRKRALRERTGLLVERRGSRLRGEKKRKLTKKSPMLKIRS